MSSQWWSVVGGRGLVVDRLRLNHTYLCSIEIWTWPTDCFCPMTLGKLPPTYWRGLWRANHTNLLERLHRFRVLFEQLLQTGVTTKCITVVNNNSRALLLEGARTVAQKNRLRLPSLTCYYRVRLNRVL